MCLSVYLDNVKRDSVYNMNNDMLYSLSLSLSIDLCKHIELILNYNRTLLIREKIRSTIKTMRNTDQHAHVVLCV